MTVDGQIVPTARLARRDTLLLAYLVLERDRRVAQSELAEVLWEDRLPATWKTALRGSVSRVRALLAGAGLPDATLVTGVGWCELRLPPQTTVDVESAAGAVGTAANLLRAGAPIAAGDLDRAGELAAGALGVARLPFLVACHAAWVDQRQQLLDDLRLRCLGVLASVALHSGDWASAREHAGTALGLAPLRESVHRLIALAHAGAGDRGEALRVLAACRQVLAEELGASLSPETEALSVGLLRGVPFPTLLASATPATGEADRAAVGLETFPDSSTPLVGRTLESGRLLEAFKRASGGTPELAIVVGEAGAGKSRLVTHLAMLVAELGATVLHGRCDDAFGGEVLVEVLRGHARAFATEAQSPAALAESLRSTLCRLGAQAPVLLVLDDLHALERHGLSLIRYVLRCPDPLPLLLVGTFRTGEAESQQRLARAVAAGRGVRPVTCLELAGLSETEVADLVCQVAAYPPTTALTASIVDATAGNPLFVRELLQLWTDQGRTVVTAGELAGPGAGADAVPDGVRETILARYRRLSPPTRRVLTVAAVAGREIDLAQLEVVPELSTVDVLAALEEAVGARLMIERSVGRFCFVHGLVPEALRRELSAARRQRLHIDLATALEARPGTAAPDPARVAYHLLRGGPAAAERAVVAASRAAAAAQHRHAYADAAEYYTAALAVAGTDPVVACRLRLEQAWALWRAGEMGRAREAFAAAAGAARAAGRPDLAAQAVFGAAGHGPSLGFCDQGLADEIATAARDLGPHDPFRPRLLARLGAEVAGAPDPAGAEHCRTALALAQAQDDATTAAYARHCLNWASLGDPDDRDGLARTDEIIETSVLLSDRHMEIEGRLWRCTYLLRAGRIADAAAEAETLASTVTALRQPFFLRLPLRLRTTLAVLRGDDGTAEALAAEAYAMERAAHPRDAETHALLRDVALAHTRGRWPDLGPRLSAMDGPHWTVVRAVWLAAAGRRGEAAAAAAPVLAGGALRHNPLAAFVGTLLAGACATDHRFAARVDVAAVRSLLAPWAGTHAVAGCAVASLGPVADYLAALG